MKKMHDTALQGPYARLAVYPESHRLLKMLAAHINESQVVTMHCALMLMAEKRKFTVPKDLLVFED